MYLPRYITIILLRLSWNISFLAGGRVPNNDYICGSSLQNDWQTLVQANRAPILRSDTLYTRPRTP